MTDYDHRQLKAIQGVDLEMSVFFAGFCRENGLLCYLCGGGCIGAVRHNGFIPWDDDLDFFMPRDDYEKLKLKWKKHERYELIYPTEGYNDHNCFMTLRDRQTTMIKDYQKDLDIVHGISIDIFPLDGCPSSRLQRLDQIICGLLYQLYCSQLVPVNHGRFVRFAGHALLAMVPAKKMRYRIWSTAERRMSRFAIKDCEYITEICAGPHYMMNRYPKELFSGAIDVPFEDKELPIPIGYDGYLRIAFGDYMELPPEEKRVPQHAALITDTAKPYTAYNHRYE